MDYRRKHYRSAPEEWWSIEAEIENGGKTIAVDVIDVSGGGMCVSFDEDMGPPLELGSTVIAVLRAEEFGSPIQAAAVVMSTEAEAEGGRHTFGLEFIDWLGLSAALPKTMTSVFNLRADARLAMDPAVQTKVSVRDFDDMLEICGVLCCLSRSGMSFRAKLTSQRILQGTDYCIVEFTPPGIERCFTFGACIRYRRLEGESMRFGVWFDPEMTREFGVQQTALKTYVDGCLKSARHKTFTP